MAMAERPHTPEHSGSYRPHSTADTPLASGKLKNSGCFRGQGQSRQGNLESRVSLMFMLMLISHKYNYAHARLSQLKRH